MRWSGWLAAIALTLCGAANAEVKAKAPDGFSLQIVVESPLDRDATWQRLLDIGAWWSKDHSYSGKDGAMSLDAKAGGCWCEIWSGGEVEHGRVVAVMPRDLLRISAALGPLQDMGVSAALTFHLADGSKPGTTKLTVDYHVTGSAVSNLDGIAGVVDAVTTQQVNRLAVGK